MDGKIILLLLAVIPFLTNLYTLKYLYDVKKNEHCRTIDSKLVTFYYDFELISTIILVVSIIGIFTKLVDVKDLVKFPQLKKIVDMLASNSKILDGLSILFSGGLIKIITDLRKEEECRKLDKNMATNIYYYSIAGVVFSILNILNIKVF